MDGHHGIESKPHEIIVGIFKCRQGLPLKPTMKDRVTLRSWSNLNTATTSISSNHALESIATLETPFILGLFTSNYDGSSLLIQDMGFFHVPSLTDPIYTPLKSCKIKILNIGPLVEHSVELVYPQGSRDAVYEKEERELLQDQRRVWIKLHNKIWSDVASAKPKRSALESKLDSISLI